MYHKKIDKNIIEDYNKNIGGYLKMKQKKLFAICALILAVGLSLFFVYKKPAENIEVVTDNSNVKHVEHKMLNKKKSDSNNAKIHEKIKSSEINQEVDKKQLAEDDKNVRKVNLYTTDTLMPLSTISVISSLPKNIQNKVLQISQTNNIFMAKKQHDKLLIIADNPDNIRHCVQFIEITLKNGHQITTTLGYNDKMKDSDNDIWEYDETTKQPIRHSKYNSDGDVEFVETWSYGSEPVKYEMKDNEGHVLSMRKETLDGGTNLRIEHLVYDKSGNTKINVSTMYEGADVKRFTYYNADKPSDGGSVFSEFSDGLKTKETVYSNDLKVVNSYTSEYEDGERKDITVWDNNNKEVEKLVPAEVNEAL